MAVETKIVTADELLRIPDDDFVYELVDGEIRKRSPAGFEHGHIAMLLGASLSAHVRAHRLGKVTAAETGFLIRRNPDTVRAPDAAFVKQERLVDSPGYFPGAPDLAIEVISPNDTYSDVNAKVNDWLRAGVRMVIVVDPSKKNATVHQSLTEAIRLALDDTLDGGEVVSGWKLALRELFGE
jgi:Uma2 family endonuclease